MNEKCGSCQHDPACGSAEINGVRYCHGECSHEDESIKSCYEVALDRRWVVRRAPAASITGLDRKTPGQDVARATNSTGFAPVSGTEETT